MIIPVSFIVSDQNFETYETEKVRNLSFANFFRMKETGWNASFKTRNGFHK